MRILFTFMAGVLIGLWWLSGYRPVWDALIDLKIDDGLTHEEARLLTGWGRLHLAINGFGWLVAAWVFE